MKSLTLSCLLAATLVQATLAQVLIGPETSFSNSTISSAQVLVDNTLEAVSANFPVILLAEPRTAADGAKACAKLGELPYAAQSRALPSVQNVLDNFAGNQTTFYIDNSSSSDVKNKSTTNNSCSTLSMANGKATINQNVDCTVALPTLCSNTNLNGKVNVRTRLGDFTGMRDQRGFRFRGIRYAKPAVRFASPEPITSRWTTPVDATKFGNICPQNSGGADDCLFLNVFTPKLTASKSGPLPVMFYIHGGSFTSGSGSDPAFDGANMASRGNVVVVQINYRLGLFGFFERSDAGISRWKLPGNQGVRDMLLALQWTRDNIIAFGGDPQQVTIFGESAGGHAVRTLLSMPKAATGLFRAAISQSDPLNFAFNTAAVASSVSGDAMAVLKCNDLACMRSKSIAEIMAAQNSVISHSIAKSPEENFMELIKPTIDGILIFNNFDQLIAGKNGGIIKVPLMIGTMKNEGDGFIPSLGQTTPQRDMTFGITADVLLGYQRAMITSAYNMYPINDADSDPDRVRTLEGVFSTDYLWVCPTQFISKAFAATGTPIYQYSFQIAYSNAPANSMCHGRTCHGDDIPTVFASPQLLNDATAYPWSADDAALSRMAMDRWLAFGISGGNPNPKVSDGYPTWPQYDGKEQSIFMFNAKPTVSTGGLRQPYCGWMDTVLHYDFQL
ncbi:hypothetical protein BGZ83_002965 [Gryganskiella cystojenkinii]|nr:hypothetical protein BGZ83_002965 [Gryganskiella cystojenkinii]